MMYRERGKKGPWLYLLAAMVFAVYIASYCFALEAYSVLPWYREENIQTTQSDNLYVVPREDGTYDIYYNGELMENTDTLELYIGTSFREE